MRRAICRIDTDASLVKNKKRIYLRESIYA